MDSIKKTQIKAQDKAQIKIQVWAFIFDKASIIVLVEYFNYNNIFLIENTIKYLKHTGINVSKSSNLLAANYDISIRLHTNISFSSKL